jgi:hypothetical protein
MVLRETHWSWDAYMNTPRSVVDRLIERLNTEHKQRQADERKSKRRG